MRKKYLRQFLLLAILPIIVLSLPYAVQAQGISASELIDAVNAFRATYGLQAYQVDGNLMAVAQAHSEYQASINKVTHTREDGSGPGDHGISSENIAGGYSVSAQTLINVWSDYWHTFTMIGFTEGLVGAGVATGDDGFLYYTLVVKNTGERSGLPDESAPTSTGGAAAAETIQATPTPFATATPQQDGSIIHIVGPGETLWSISNAYGVLVDVLAAMNNLDSENPLIYPGQSIQVRAGNTPTATATITNTPLPPTRTLRPTRTPQPAVNRTTITPEEAQTGNPLLPENSLINQDNLRTLGTITIVVTLLGISALVAGRIWGRGKK